MKEKVQDTEGTLETEGLPKTETASEDQKSTPSQDGDLQLDPKKLYDIKGKKVLGHDLIQKMNRGEGYDQLQSQLHKATEQLKEIQKERDTLAQQVQLKQSKDQILATLADLGITPASAKGAKSLPEDDWLTGSEEESEEGMEQKIDPQKLADYLSGLKNTTVKEVEPDISRLVDTKFNGYLQEQDDRRKNEEFDRNLLTSRRDSLRERFPDAKDSDIETLIQLEKGRTAAIEMVRQSQMDKDYNQAREFWGKQSEMEAEISELLADMKIAQDRASQRKKDEAEVTMLSTGGPEWGEEETNAKPLPPKKAEEERKKWNAEAKKALGRLRQISNLK